MTEVEKQKAKNTLIQAGAAFLQSPAGAPFLSKLAVATAGAAQAKLLLESAKEVKKLIDDNTPVISTFTTTGRIYNATTNEPLAGVEVKPILALFPMKLVTKTRTIKIPDPDGKKNILGKVKKIEVEETYKEYEYDGDGNKTLKTDEKGEFEIRFGVPTLPKNNQALVKPVVLYTKEGLAPDYQTLITQDQEVLKELPIKSLINIEDAADVAVIKLKTEANAVAEKAANLALSVVEQSILAIKGRILSFASVVQNKLFPLAMGLMIIFGITKIAAANVREEVAEGRCPSDELLKEAIKRRNSIVRQLNQIYIIIIANTAVAALFLYLTQQLKSGKLQISALPFPVSTPPGIGVPQFVLAILEDIKELFTTLGDISTELRKALLISLLFLIIALIIILRYLKKIDAMIEKCVVDSDSDISMEEINSELLGLQIIDEEQGSPIINNVNGFIMSVVSDTTNQVGDLYRRYATATNSQGVVILKGEPSFSATDQILIDELAFYIVQNNLKAD
jgi:hypothetical protein